MIDFSSHLDMGSQFRESLAEDKRVYDVIYIDNKFWILWR